MNTDLRKKFRIKQRHSRRRTVDFAHLSFRFVSICVNLWLNLRLPARSIFAAPEGQHFVVVKDVSGLWVAVERAADAVGDVPQVAEQRRFVADLDVCVRSLGRGWRMLAKKFSMCTTSPPLPVPLSIGFVVQIVDDVAAAGHHHRAFFAVKCAPNSSPSMPRGDQLSPSQRIEPDRRNRKSPCACRAFGRRRRSDICRRR